MTMQDQTHRYTPLASEDFRYDVDQNGGGRGGSPGWLAPAAIGFAAGIAATMVRKAAVQSVSAIRGDWFEALKADHRIVEKAFDKLFATQDGDVAQRTLIFGTIKGALDKHAIEEENVVYPALRMHAKESEAKHLSSDHADIKTYLAELGMMDKSGQHFIIRARKLFDLIQTHVREEEDEIYPMFRNRLTADENMKLTLRMHREGLKLA